jgi:reactive intermediate/imine deaminase
VIPRVLMMTLMLLLAACSQPVTQPTSAKPAFLNSPGTLEKGRPFSEAVRIGGFIFLAGQIGDDPATGKPAAGGIKPEARQALQHIQRILENNGATLADVVKCTVFLADIGEWATFNEVYKEFFKPPYPARSALGTNGLALGARVEVECLAYVEPGAH